MLDVITPVNDVFRRDIVLDDPDLLNPTEADSLVAGEWLTLNSASKGIRITDDTTLLAYQVFTQKGDTSGQAIGKTAVLQLHAYEAETDMFDPAIALSATVGLELAVDDITIDGVVRSILKAAASGDAVQGICTKPPQNNGGKIRFQKISPYIKA